jgi:hypothetical protein
MELALRRHSLVHIAAFFTNLALGVIVPPAWKAGTLARQEQRSADTARVVVDAKGVGFSAIESELGIKDDRLWGVFPKASPQSRRNPSLADLPSTVRGTNCTHGFQRSTLLHLYDHPLLHPRELQDVKPYKSRNERAVAVGFTDMGEGCVTHYGHLVENVALSLFKHFVDQANETWAMLGEKDVPERPTIYVSDMVQMLETLQGMLPTLRLVRVPWVPQVCMHTSSNGCSSMPKSLVDGLPLLHLSSNGFPAVNVRTGEPSSLNGLGWAFLSQNPLVHRSLQGLVQRFRNFVRGDACGLASSMAGAPSKTKKVLLIERRPDLAATPEHQRTLGHFDALIDAAKSLNEPGQSRDSVDGKLLNVTSTFLEGASFAQQCNALGHTHVLVAQHGAALVNCLFLPDGAKVLEIAAPDRRMVKFFCSDLLPFQHYRLDSTEENRERRFMGALVHLLGRKTPTGTATPSNVGVSFLNLLEQLVPRGRTALDEACDGERNRSFTGSVSLKETVQGSKHLIIAAGQGGSSTRAINLALAELPQVAIGPLRGDKGNPLTVLRGVGLDSMALQLPNFVGVPYVHAAQSIASSSSDSGHLTNSKMAEFLQSGACETIRAILEWRDQCSPTSTHAVLKDPFFLQFMPYIIDAPNRCKEVAGGLGATKFIHVVRDPRIHHHTHIAMELYDATFNGSQRREHMARLKDKFHIKPHHQIEGAFNEHKASTAEGVAKFALVWQWQALTAHRDWKANRPNDYFLARVEDISQPADASRITDTYTKMLQVLEIPRPGKDVLAKLRDAYEPYTSLLAKEAPLKVQIIEEFAQEGLREFGYISGGEPDSAGGVVRSEGALADLTVATSPEGMVRSDQNPLRSERLKT